ncbi:MULTISPECIES: c-type cytochrome domain-containing protein [unclassified Arcicella]|uniref:c-type cytochrome domain-containing protein n=1 Tax=unclassified Arcicella TaxID=2644986 RepID=UPI00285D585A|nr:MULTISPECIES: c-type cytochrome domain-containing protein [unclassified Arcicella]MDR6560106.1 putative membrane protein/mono/diheme cytochrome c family protein [Arcicella sp. BE51]MDR6810287.1 putative membrane protein/mono/diheme cytochrome c family protein [Arcicella sp. BE140]MDR6821637.1 putative membrane protein/mono/diheme cytochrome c family protein [Arcicella sp. BE139]
MILLQTNVPSDWAMFFGHFHPVVVHLPIGMLMIAAILELISRKKGLESLQPAIAPILFWGMITAVISCIFGYLLSTSGEYNEETLFLHQWMGIGVALVALAAWYMKVNWQQDPTMKKAYMPAVYLIVILLTGTGHLGGNMTHGEDYLYAYTPEPFRSMAGLPPRTKGGTGVRKKIENINEALVYQDIVAPVMEQKCWSCHNANKIKGGLRMDTQELLIKGGENGAIIKANDAANSELIKRLLLPEEDEHHMPPKGKTPLSEQEISLLHWWIQNGAGFDKKVAQLKPDEKVKPFLASLSSGGETNNTSGGESISPVFNEKVSAAAESDIQKLTSMNVVVMSVSKEQHFLDVNFVNARTFDDSKINLLTNLSDQIIWLKLGSTKITDKSLAEISKLKHLTRLHLEHTAITDVGLAQLKDLEFLEYINLFDTQISDVGIKELAKLKSLKKVYCWQTKVTKQGVLALQKALPNVEVNIGWEDKIPTNDTNKVITQKVAAK